MRWPWQRDVTTDPKAHKALATAEAQFREQQGRQSQVDLVTTRLVERRQQNRFAELFEHALNTRRGQK